MAKMQKKNLDTSPDETQTFEDGKMELAKFDKVTIGRVLLQPGWSWEKSVKPIVNTDTCQSSPHSQYIISGRIKVVLDNGTEEELGPGDVAMIPSGHKTWVVGNEPVVGIDFTGLKEYAKS
jgi:mannose-6-phosphate isomerase-like protein (cupin superfamily)